MTALELLLNKIITDNIEETPVFIFGKVTAVCFDIRFIGILSAEINIIVNLIKFWASV